MPLTQTDQVFKDAAPKIMITKPDSVPRRVKDYSRIHPSLSSSFEAVKCNQSSSFQAFSPISVSQARFLRGFFQNLHLAYMERKKGNTDRAFQIIQPYFASFFPQSQREQLRGKEELIANNVIDRVGEAFWSKDEADVIPDFYSEKELNENFAQEKRALESLLQECSKHEILAVIGEALFARSSCPEKLLMGG